MTDISAIGPKELIKVLRFSAHDVTWGIFPGDRVCVSTKGGTRGSGWVHSQFPQGVNGVSQARMNCTKPLLGAGSAISLASCMNGCRKESYHLLRPPNWVFMAVSCALVSWHCSCEYSLVNGTIWRSTRDQCWDITHKSNTRGADDYFMKVLRYSTQEVEGCYSTSLH